MSQRFHLDEPVGNQNSVVLAGPEATHLIRVMRAKSGDQVVLFDGSGVEFVGVITELGRGTVELRIETREEVDREIEGRLTMGIALPKGDRQRWVVEKLVELGVTQLVPLHAERSVARIDDKARQRLERYVIEASKQCGRNRLMNITPAQSLATFLVEANNQSLRWFLHLGEVASPPSPSPRALSSACVAVGPEGGWTKQESAAAANAGWEVVSLGPRTLRVETAALFAASILVSG